MIGGYQIRRLFWGAVLCLGSVACSTTKASRTPVNTAPPVSITVVGAKDLPVLLHATGVVEAHSSVAVKAQVTSELVGVYFREGQMVRKGDLLFALDKRPFEAELSKQQGTLEHDVAQAELAQSQLKRYAALFNEGVISKDQYDQAKANTASLDALVQADRGGVETSKIQLQYCSIISPLTGRAGSFLLHQGSIAKANDAPLVTINTIEPIFVSFAIPEQDLAQVKHFSKLGSLNVSVTPTAAEPRKTGALVFIDNTADPTTGTVKLKAEFPNANETLWPGQFVDVTLTLTTQRNAIWLPSQAVVTAQDGPMVFVLKPDMTVEARSISVARTEEGLAVIAKGLSPGERVVIDGQLRLVTGAKVRVKGDVSRQQERLASEGPNGG